MTKININNVTREVSDAPAEETKSGVISLVIENLKSYPKEILDVCKKLVDEFDNNPFYACIKSIGKELFHTLKDAWTLSYHNTVVDTFIQIVKFITLIGFGYITYIAFTTYSAWAWPILGVTMFINMVTVVIAETIFLIVRSKSVFLCENKHGQEYRVNFKNDTQCYVIDSMFKPAIVIPADLIEFCDDASYYAELGKIHCMNDVFGGIRGAIKTDYYKEVDGIVIDKGSIEYINYKLEGIIGKKGLMANFMRRALMQRVINNS